MRIAQESFIFLPYTISLRMLLIWISADCSNIVWNLTNGSVLNEELYIQNSGFEFDISSEFDF